VSQIVATAAELQELAHEILRGLGTPEPAARTVAQSLVGANLVGHDSHGVVRLLEYASCVRAGDIVPTAEPVVRHAEGAVSAIDGRWCWGQVGARFAAERAAESALEHGIGLATLEHCKHVGRIGEFAELLAERGLLSFVFCNSDACVAPFGGAERALGTNPLAAGIPGTGEHPFVLDFATSAAAEGKLRVARAEGATIPEGIVVDRDGRPSTDPEAFYDGGALLPFGSHKGYGLSAFIELVGGALSGNHPSLTSRYHTGNGLVVIAIRPGALGTATYAADIEDGAAALRAVSPTDPARPVLLPGDVENAALRQRRAEGMPVSEKIWQELHELRDELTSTTPEAALA